MPLSPGRAGVDSEDRRGRRPLPSTPHIASVETASYAGVGSAFHNCPPVGKQSHFVGRVPEFQHEFVVSHHAVRLQAALQLAKIDGPGALVYLHRIASAQSDMGTSLFCNKTTPAHISTLSLDHASTGGIGPALIGPA